MIPQLIKDEVKIQVLVDLQLYFDEAEEIEDEDVQQCSTAERLKDFYLYQHEAQEATQ